MDVRSAPDLGRQGTRYPLTVRMWYIRDALFKLQQVTTKQIELALCGKPRPEPHHPVAQSQVSENKKKNIIWLSLGLLLKKIKSSKYKNTLWLTLGQLFFLTSERKEGKSGHTRMVPKQPRMFCSHEEVFTELINKPLPVWAGYTSGRDSFPTIVNQKMRHFSPIHKKTMFVELSVAEIIDQINLDM